MTLFSTVFKERPSKYLFHINEAVFWRICLAGALSGLAIWLIAAALDAFVLGQILCGSSGADTDICVNTVRTSSYLALVLVGVMMVPIMALHRVRRPLLVVIAATIALWGVAGMWTGGPWVLSLILTVVASMFVYATVVWINRIRGNVAAIVFLALFVLLTRLVIGL
ncbi:MAG: hypothetical protein Q4F02_02040 [Candidatus Saccharibacteria bacterium]|nr:hypothetical protein [Candidatus Saccharibacteria bacterium]